MIFTIAIGVALGIFIAAGLFYAANRWGSEALHRSTVAGGWLWRRKLRVGLVAGAIVALPITAVVADYIGVLLYENFNSTSGKYHAHPYDPDFDIRAELMRLDPNKVSDSLGWARNKQHFHAIVADEERRQAHREQLCKSPWRDWRPAMAIMQFECQRLAQAAARRIYDEAWRNRPVPPMFPTSR